MQLSNYGLITSLLIIRPFVVPLPKINVHSFVSVLSLAPVCR